MSYTTQKNDQTAQPKPFIKIEQSIIEAVRMVAKLHDEKADKAYVDELFAELKALILNGDTGAAFSTDAEGNVVIGGVTFTDQGSGIVKLSNATFTEQEDGTVFVQ